MKRTKAILFALLGISGLLVGGGLLMFHEQKTEYEYTVKMSEVENTESVEDSTDVENLSSEQQPVLHAAFKKSDHLLGSSSATVTFYEPQPTFEGWHVVTVEGVPLLVSVTEETIPRVTLIGVMQVVLGFALIAGGFWYLLTTIDEEW